MANSIDCPVDLIPVNENRVRLTALWVFLLVVTALLLNKFGHFVFAFLTVDFFLRAFKYGKISPLNILSGAVVKKLNIPNKPIDQAPKRFAAGIGFVLSLAVFVFIITGFSKTVIVLSIIFAAFAFLESFLAFCAGCRVYTLLVRLKLIRKQ
ncbi:DUF4395 domain-containing protein [Ferruginibacter albus]|uniref:DUF4395 domain-containing protein n=1 Tax=Ferruginibacter albus TaxID=2875540 RepID=UPI001CC82B3C|nr:DUF4395 domain-containing protein [Ferruginibacter albus]UAY52162.1 DUF4395 domain-containing protein [Ferruginibacter albus]